MPGAENSRIHPTAIVSPEAELADDVRIGPYAVIEGKVRLGPGCVVRPHVHLIGPLTMGCQNLIYTGAVIGERPQHLKYNDEPTGTEIGNHNTFREHVTVHRGTTHSWTTRIGSRNFFMAHSHVAHDCRIGNACILANCALVGGHCTLEDGVYMAGNSAVHQFVRIGRLALLSGASATTTDIPPFIMQQNVNEVVGVNVVGMRRAGIPTADINVVRKAFHIIYREGNVIPQALAKLEEQFPAHPLIAELASFIRASKRGIVLRLARGQADAA
jgi:UDP-N-acetylglucosamine acyltransferase